MPKSVSPFLLSLFFFCSVPAAPPAPPALFVAQTEADLGEARSGTKLTHTFRLENRGQRLLQIRNIRASCGCTASDISTREIPAGGYAILTASLDLTGRTGPQSEQIRIQSNDPETPNLTLTLRAAAVPNIRVTPQTLNFQMISPTEPPTGTIVIESSIVYPLEITGIQSQQGRVETDLQTIDPGKRYELNVTPRMQAGPGHYTDQLVLHTNDPETPSVQVWVMWQISEAVTVAPRQMNLVLDPGASPVTRFILVRGLQDLDPPLKIRSVHWEGRDIETTVTASGHFGTRLEIRFTPEAGMHGETIQIKTNVAGFETLNIPVNVLRP